MIDETPPRKEVRTSGPFRRYGMNAVAVAAFVAAIPGSVLALRQLRGTPQADVQATVTYGEMPLPPGYAGGGYLRIMQAVDSALDMLPIAPPSPGRPGADRAEIQRAVLGALARPGVAPLYIGGHPAPEVLGGYWHAVVRNGGTQQAERVRLTLPEAVYACVARDGSPPPACTEVAGFQDLGTLLPGEGATVTAWMRRSIGPSFQTDSLRLAYAQGVGAVVLPQRPAAPGGWSTLRTVILNTYGAFGLLLFFVPLLFGWILNGVTYERRWGGSRHARDEPTA